MEGEGDLSTPLPAVVFPRVCRPRYALRAAHSPLTEAL